MKVICTSNGTWQKDPLIAHLALIIFQNVNSELYLAALRQLLLRPLSDTQSDNYIMVHLQYFETTPEVGSCSIWPDSCVYSILLSVFNPEQEGFISRLLQIISLTKKKLQVSWIVWREKAVSPWHRLILIFVLTLPKLHLTAQELWCRLKLLRTGCVPCEAAGFRCYFVH